jgi:hypothetical protein
MNFIGHKYGPTNLLNFSFSLVAAALQFWREHGARDLYVRGAAYLRNIPSSQPHDHSASRPSWHLNDIHEAANQ